jgi:hypothetical protein
MQGPQQMIFSPNPEIHYKIRYAFINPALDPAFHVTPPTTEFGSNATRRD